MADPTDTDPEVLYLESGYEGERYRWCCAWCGEVVDEEFDPRNQVVMCDACGNQSKVVWSA